MAQIWNIAIFHGYAQNISLLIIPTNLVMINSADVLVLGSDCIINSPLEYF